MILDFTFDLTSQRVIAESKGDNVARNTTVREFQRRCRREAFFARTWSRFRYRPRYHVEAITTIKPSFNGTREQHTANNRANQNDHRFSTNIRLYTSTSSALSNRKIASIKFPFDTILFLKIRNYTNFATKVCESTKINFF